MSSSPPHPELPSVGKVDASVFDRLILPRLGRPRSDVVVGPRNGVDVGVLSLGDGRVLVTSTDPFFLDPGAGWERSAWFAVHILASDLATSGVAPTHLTVDLNLPLAMKREELEQVWQTVHRECDRLGIAIVAGHTGRYGGCAYPMVGGATIFGFAPEDAYITPAMAAPGDEVLLTKGPAIEASALFATSFRNELADAYGEEFARAADGLFEQMSVVDDALTAASVGLRDKGVTAMHDATEGGVWGGLSEIASASGIGLHIEEEAIPMPATVRQICDHWGIDPMISISEGTLLLTCRPGHSGAILDRLRERGIKAARIGTCLRAEEGCSIEDAGGAQRALVHPRTDPFWRAYGEALAARAEDSSS
jgi:hydrogenase maturation factor